MINSIKNQNRNNKQKKVAIQGNWSTSSFIELLATSNSATIDGYHSIIVGWCSHCHDVFHCCSFNDLITILNLTTSNIFPPTVLLVLPLTFTAHGFMRGLVEDSNRILRAKCFLKLYYELPDILGWQISSTWFLRIDRKKSRNENFAKNSHHYTYLTKSATQETTIKICYVTVNSEQHCYDNEERPTTAKSDGIKPAFERCVHRCCQSNILQRFFSFKT